MGEQVALTWGGIVLAEPSNGKDGYLMIKDNVTQVDFIEVAVPGTKGRIRIARGIGQSDETSTCLEFKVESCFGSFSDYQTFRDAIQSKVTDPEYNIDLVTYGVKNYPGGNSVNDCKMQYEYQEDFIDSDGDIHFLFTVRFTKVSG